MGVLELRSSKTLKILKKIKLSIIQVLQNIKNLEENYCFGSSEAQRFQNIENPKEAARTTGPHPTGGGSLPLGGGGGSAQPAPTYRERETEI